MLLENGVIRTLDPARPVVGSLAIAGAVVGGRGGGEHVDLAGCCVVPGFTDAHVHFPMWATAQRQVRLEGSASLDEAVARVAAAARAGAPRAWIVGHGWRSLEWRPAREPTRHDLDPATGDTPVALRAKDGHSLWLNTAALARAQGDLAVPGGVVETDDRGEPTGVLREESAWRFQDRFVHVSEAELLEAVRDAIAIAHARGVTAVHDKDGGRGALAVWQELQARGELTLRVWQSLPHERVEELERIGMRSPLGNDYLRVGYLKAFMDGALGSQTALMLGGGGVEITSRSEFAEIVRCAARAGWPVAVHAIGDAANRSALDAFEETREEWAPRGLRQRIEHAQLLHSDDLPRFAELGVAASVQFSHCPSDRDLVDEVWTERAHGAYAFRSLWESGVLVANGSDAPIEELDPLAGIQAGVARSLDGRPPWHPRETLTVDQALLATCVNPAWLAGDEGRRGRLRDGELADLVVLDRDPFECPPAEIGAIGVVATMVGGAWVHGAAALEVIEEQEMAAR